MKSDYNFPGTGLGAHKGNPFLRIAKETPSRSPGFTLNLKKKEIRSSPIFSEPISKSKNEFIPFINERDHLNRLITASSSPENEAKKYQTPTNPALYYKSNKFNKSTLRVKHMKRTKNSLSSLLDIPGEKKDQNLLAEKSPRKNETEIDNFSNYNNFAIARQQIRAASATVMKPLQFLELDAESQIGKISGRTTAMVASSSLRHFKEKIKSHRRNFSNGAATNPMHKEGSQSSKVKTEANATKNIFLATDTFSNFYVKLDADAQRITISSARMQRKTENDIDNLNHIVRNYEERKIFLDPYQIRATPNPKSMNTTLKQFKWVEKPSFLKTNPTTLYTKTDVSQGRRTQTEFSQCEIGQNFVRRTPQMNFALKGQKIF